MPNEINFISILKLFRKKLVWILLVGLLFSFCMAFYYRTSVSKQSVIVNASIQILPNLSDFSKDADSINLQMALYDKSLKNIYEMADSQKIARASTEETGAGPSVLRNWDNDVQIEYLGESGILQISVKLDSVDQSMALTNAIIKNIQNEIQANYPLVQSSLYAPAATDLYKTVQSTASKTQLIIAFLIGCLIACISIYFGDFFNHKIKTAGELEEITKHPILTTMNKKTEAESAKIVQAILSTMSSTENCKSFLFISNDEDNSKIRLIQNIANSFKKQGRSVILLDADMRNQSLSKKMKLDDKKGLLDAIQTKMEHLDMAIIKNADSADVLPTAMAGKDVSTSDLLSTDSFKGIMRTLTARYDYVFVNANAFSYYADSAIISTITDANIITVQQDKVRFSSMTDTIRSLEKLNAKIVGCILTDTY